MKNAFVIFCFATMLHIPLAHTETWADHYEMRCETDSCYLDEINHYGVSDETFDWLKALSQEFKMSINDIYGEIYSGTNAGMSLEEITERLANLEDGN
jgi:hypothetical protein